MTPNGDLVPEPEVGRRYAASRRVRLADADPRGRLRLDALARLLQDVGNDDLADAGLDNRSPWVARRTVVEADRCPRLGARMTLTTWCGALGSRWAERRTSITSDDGGRAEVASLWVFLDGASRPARLPPWFLETYAEAAQGRVVTSRLSHPPPPAQAASRPWAVRSTDLDVLGHMNNAATWSAVEDEAWRRGIVPRRAELEYHAAIDPDDVIELRSTTDETGVRLWLTVGASVRASALVSVPCS